MTDHEPPVPVGRPRLWNPNAAANWSLLFTPIFGALLHAKNWRALGEPRGAAVNMGYVWVGVAFLALNFASLFLPETETLDKVLRYGGLGLLLGWYFGQGRLQAKFVRDKYGNGYERRGWGVPLLYGVAGTIVYIVAIVAAVAALTLARPATAADLANRVEPLVLAEFRKRPGQGNPSIQSLSLTRRRGETYTGTVEATLDGLPRKFHLTVVKGESTFDWDVVPLNPEFGTLVTFKADCLYYRPPVTAAEADRLGDYLGKKGLFTGRGATYQATKSGPTYELHVPVRAGVEQDAEMTESAKVIAAEASEIVFDSAPTEVHLCDTNLVTIRVVPMN